MESHLILKMLHMLFGTFALLELLLCGVLLSRFWQPADPVASGESASVQQYTGLRKTLVIMLHVSFSLIIITGLVLLYQNQFAVKPWFYGKIILFLVVLSASFKALGRRPMSLAQRRAGIVVAVIAFISLLGLVMWKPDFSHPAAGTVIQSDGGTAQQ